MHGISRTGPCRSIAIMQGLMAMKATKQTTKRTKRLCITIRVPMNIAHVKKSGEPLRKIVLFQ